MFLLPDENKHTATPYITWLSIIGFIFLLLSSPFIKSAQMNEETFGIIFTAAYWVWLMHVFGDNVEYMMGRMRYSIFTILVVGINYFIVKNSSLILTPGLVSVCFLLLAIIVAYFYHFPDKKLRLLGDWSFKYYVIEFRMKYFVFYTIGFLLIIMSITAYLVSAAWWLLLATLVTCFLGYGLAYNLQGENYFIDTSTEVDTLESHSSGHSETISNQDLDKLVKTDCVAPIITLICVLFMFYLVYYLVKKEDIVIAIQSVFACIQLGIVFCLALQFGPAIENKIGTKYFSALCAAIFLGSFLILNILASFSAFDAACWSFMPISMVIYGVFSRLPEEDRIDPYESKNKYYSSKEWVNPFAALYYRYNVILYVFLFPALLLIIPHIFAGYLLYVGWISFASLGLGYYIGNRITTP